MSRRATVYPLMVTIGLLFVLVQSTVAQERSNGEPQIILLSRAFSPPAGLDIADSDAAARETARWRGLLQFDELPDATTRAAFEAQGGRFLGYVPHNSWLVSLPLSRAGAAIRLPQARWLGDLSPADKVAPALTDALQRSVSDESQSLLLHLHADVPLSEADELVQAHGGIVRERWETLTAVLIELPAANVSALASENKVLWLAPAPDAPQTLNDGARGNSGADIAQASPYDLTGFGVRVAIWDSGAIAHPDLLGRVALQTNLSMSQHATHVAGTLAGSGATSRQFGGSERQWRGVAPQASLLSYDFMLPIDEFPQALEFYGAQIFQNSWGFLTLCDGYGVYEGHAQLYDDIITGKYAQAPSVVFAAGNSQAYCDSPYRTVLQGAQSAKNVITVGAINSDDSSMTTFSSWGPTQDGRLKPELVAPGDERGGDGGIWSTNSGDSYGSLTGTSMAAPVVSGALALLYQHHYRQCKMLFTPRPATMRALLIHSADDLVDSSAGMHVGPDYVSGYGRLNIPRAADAVTSYWQGEIAHGDVDRFLFYSETAEPIKVTLAWDDPASQILSGQMLVNDLDLRLIAPNGAIYGPWLLNPAEPQAPAIQAMGTQRDALNVVEQVVVSDGMVGEWQIEVRGTHLPLQTQPYSLVNEQIGLSTCLLDDFNTTPKIGDDGEVPTAVNLVDFSERRSDNYGGWFLLLLLMALLTSWFVARRSNPTS